MMAAQQLAEELLDSEPWMLLGAEPTIDEGEADTEAVAVEGPETELEAVQTEEVLQTEAVQQMDNMEAKVGQCQYSLGRFNRLSFKIPRNNSKLITNKLILPKTNHGIGLQGFSVNSR